MPDSEPVSAPPRLDYASPANISPVDAPLSIIPRFIGGAWAALVIFPVVLYFNQFFDTSALCTLACLPIITLLLATELAMTLVIVQIIGKRPHRHLFSRAGWRAVVCGAVWTTGLLIIAIFFPFLTKSLNPRSSLWPLGLWAVAEPIAAAPLLLQWKHNSESIASRSQDERT